MPGDSVTYTWTVPAAGASNFSLHAIVRALQSAVTLQIESSVTPPIQLGVTYMSSSMDYIAGEQYLLIPAAVLQAGTYNLTLQTPTSQIGPSHFTVVIQTPAQTLLLAPVQHRVFQDLTALCCVNQGTAFSVTTPGSLCHSMSAWGGANTPPANWASDICQQPRQLCDASGALIRLDLMGAGLSCSGPLPASLSTLQALQALNLQGVRLNQTLQQAMSALAPLSRLTSLTMSGTGVRGSISCAAIPRQMQALSLFHNSLTGRVPSCGVTHLTSLGELYLGGNLLTGTLPNLTALTSLSFLDISSNSWHGALPPLPPSLIYLNASFTPLSGDLPAVPTTLQTLDGSYSQLNGTLPPSLSSPPLLQWIDLRGNSLHGSLPPLPAQLQFLSLSANTLSGPLPVLPGGVQYATLDSNRLSGSLPASWGMASSIRYLILNTNQLNGSLASSMTSPLLEILDLGFNRLTGQVPACLASLSSLSRLMLNNNALHGQLDAFASALAAPSPSPSFQSGFGSLDVGNNGNSLLFVDFENNLMTGTVPSGLANLRLFQLLPGDTAVGDTRALALANNSMTGQMPDWVFTALPRFLSECFSCQIYISLQGNQLGCPENPISPNSIAATLLQRFNFYCVEADSGQLQPLIGGAALPPPPTPIAASAAVFLWEGGPHVGRGSIDTVDATQAGFILAPPIPSGE
ncbi:MAG: hypothetical protein WDW36_002986 [Sanguina aurantia]